MQTFDMARQQYQDNLAEIERLQTENRALQQTLRAEALNRITAIARAVGMSTNDLANMAQKAASSRPVRYRHPDGRTWTGSGRRPQWLAGHEGEYSVKAAA